jgi:type II secretory pathway pseudopilin PulG
MVKNRPAITLFITLAVIVAMLSLVAIVFSYLSQARSKAQDKAALIQANVIYADAVDTLKRFIGKKPTTNILKNIYTIPLTVAEEKGSFNMLTACTPSCAAIPITWFSQKGGAKEQERLNLATRVFEEVTTQARLREPETLLRLISEAVDSTYNIEFGKSSRLKRAKKHLGFREFQKILTQYRLKTDDDRVYKISWNLYFSFGQYYSAIDGNFLSAKLISTIFAIDEQIVQEDFKSGKLKEFLQNNGADLELYNSSLFAKEPVAAMKCATSYTFGKGSYSFSFKYNNGKVDNFEFVQ